MTPAHHDHHSSRFDNSSNSTILRSQPFRRSEGHMKDQVAVIGVGCTNFGDLFEHGYEDLICEAAFQAYADAKIDPQDIQAAYLGTYMPGRVGRQGGGVARRRAAPLRPPDHARRELLRHRHRRLSQRLPGDRLGRLRHRAGARRREAEGPRRPRPAALRSPAARQGQLGARPLCAGGQPLHAHVRRRPRDARQDRGEEPLQRRAQPEGAPAHGDHRGARC